MQGEISLPQTEANGKPQSFVLSKPERKPEQPIPISTSNIPSSSTTETASEAIASAETLEELAKKLSSLSTTGAGASCEVEEQQKPVDPIKYLSINKQLNAENSSTPATTPKSPKTEGSGSETKSTPGSIEGELPIAFADFDEEDLSVTEYFATVIPSISPEPWDYTYRDNNQQEEGDIEIDIDLNSIESLEDVGSHKGSILDPNEYRHIFDDENYLREVVQEINAVKESAFELDPSAFDLAQAFDTLDLQAESNDTPATAIGLEQDQPGQTSKSGKEEKSKSANKIIRNRPILQLPQSTDASFLYCHPCSKDAEDFTTPEDIIDTLPKTDTDISEEEFLSGFEFDPVVFEELLKIIEEEVNQNLDTPQDYFGIDTGHCIEVPSEPSSKAQTKIEDNIRLAMDNTANTTMSQNPIIEEEDSKRQHKDEEVTRQEHEGRQQEESEVTNSSPAIVAATPIIDAFQGSNERQCLGHQSQVFALSISECGKYCATASQDSSVIVWDVEKNSQLSKIKGSPDHECLRVAWASEKWCDTDTITIEDADFSGFRRTPGDLVLATSGADGVATIWQSLNDGREWKSVASFNHPNAIPEKAIGGKSIVKMQNDSGENNDGQTEGEEQEDENKNDGTEVYSLQFIDRWVGLPTLTSDGHDTDSLGVFMTSSDDFIHIWQHCPHSQFESDSVGACNKNFEKIMDIKFTHLQYGYGGVFVHLSSSGEYPSWTKASGSNIVTDARCFGGERNPDNLVFVFDAAQCPANNLLGVALSDGTLRLVNGRGICVTILQLPGCQSHLTSFAWDKSGRRLASCVATGHVVLWDIDYGDGKGNVHPVCRSVLEGGHNPGRPLFGASFFSGEDENLLLSWGVDGKVVLWDSYSRGQIGEPICVLVSKEDYPIYAVDVAEGKTNQKSTIGVAGGTDGGFIGLPLFFFDF